MTKLTIMARELTRAIDMAASVVDRNSNIAILRTVQIVFGGGKAITSATNGHQYVRVTVAAEGEATIHVDASALAAKSQALKPDLPASIDVAGASATISQGRTRWTMPVVNDDFPAFAPVKGKPVSTSGADFIAALGCVSHAAATQDARQNLNGVYFDAGIVVAANGRALASVEFPPLAKLPKVIIPIGSIQKIERMFREAGELTMVADDRAAVISDGDIEFRTTLIGEKFVEWRRAIPSGQEKFIRADAAFMADAIARASNVTEIGKATIPLRIECAANNEIMFSTDNRNGETGEDACEADIEGDIAPFGVDAANLGPAIQSLGGRVKISVIEPNAAIKIEREDGTRGTRIVMPVMI